MLEKCQNAKERWGGVSDLIDQWLEQRQSLIRTFVALPACEIGQPLNEKLVITSYSIHYTKLYDCSTKPAAAPS